MARRRSSSSRRGPTALAAHGGRAPWREPCSRKRTRQPRSRRRVAAPARRMSKVEKPSKDQIGALREGGELWVARGGIAARLLLFAAALSALGAAAVAGRPQPAAI